MTRVNVPHRPISGDDEIVEHIIADFDHVQDIANGKLQAETNVKVTAPTDPLDGNSNAEGISDSLARADHKHVIRGVENLDTNPVGSHFESRLFYDKTTHQLKINRDPVLGTYLPISNLSPADFADHAANHGVGGQDPIPNGGISSDMLGRSIQTMNLPNPVTDVTQAYVIALTMSPITLPVAQVVTFNGQMIFDNTSSGTDIRIAWQIVDTANSNALIAARFGLLVHSGTNGAAPISAIVNAAAGNHTYQLQIAQQGVTATPSNVDAVVNFTPIGSVQMLSQLSLVVG